MHLYSSLSPSQISVVVTHSSQTSDSNVVKLLQIEPQALLHVLSLWRMQLLHSDHSPHVDGQSCGVVHSSGTHVSFGLHFGSTPSTSNSTTRTGSSQVPSHLDV